MKAEQNQEPQHDVDRHVAVSSLDTNGDGLVTMREINPPRPENGHDLANTATAGGAVMLAVFVTAAAAGVAQRIRTGR